MNINPFKEKAYDHLAKYKKEVLGCDYRGVHDDGDYRTVLPPNIEGNRMNLLQGLPYYPRTETNPNRYANYLNSSKTLSYNLFSPLTKDEWGQPLFIRILNEALSLNLEPDIALESIRQDAFPYPVWNEETMDAIVKLTNGQRILFCVSYCETVYRRREGFWINSEKYETSPCCKTMDKDTFYRNYVINRNLAQVKEPNDLLVFLLPFRNNILYNELTDVLKNNPCITNQVKVIDLELFVELALQHTFNTSLYRYYRIFKQKYLEF